MPHELARSTSPIPFRVWCAGAERPGCACRPALHVSRVRRDSTGVYMRRPHAACVLGTVSSATGHGFARAQRVPYMQTTRGVHTKVGVASSNVPHGCSSRGRHARSSAVSCSMTTCRSTVVCDTHAITFGLVAYLGSHATGSRHACTEMCRDVSRDVHSVPPHGVHRSVPPAAGRTWCFRKFRGAAEAAGPCGMADPAGACNACTPRGTGAAGGGVTG